MTTLYLVDDHAILRESLRLLLQAWGHTVVGEAADPGHALSDIQKLQPAVLLLDLHLQAHCGLELLTEVRRRKLATQCVVLTMLEQPRMVTQALSLGALAYVLKASPARELALAIDAASLGQRYLGPQVMALAARAHGSKQANNPIEALSLRQRQIITLVVMGMSSTRIAAQLHLSPKTVATYRSRLMTKLEVHDLPSLVRLAIRHQLVDAEPQA
jgi:DNA-binding NarL/FixJ family response regulator